MFLIWFTDFKEVVWSNAVCSCVCARQASYSQVSWIYPKILDKVLQKKTKSKKKQKNRCVCVYTLDNIAVCIVLKEI
jgi:hypothetical protein